jgi:hypothetical protein
MARVEKAKEKLKDQDIVMNDYNPSYSEGGGS